ncbi:hypothetical protein XELAEV_18038077mg [Xenopus laevis]|uniref:Ig-like domain-containing protein n=1 Tax=Xenopus laevis TaxID=8355 RepID=A0A974CDV5_XENLA|nr:hypothetical protein XELAEV_18038077mg [Xenopus laevis]
MPQSISAFRETCVSIPCTFDYPKDIRPSIIHGIWYFNSPYPKNLPPVVLKTKTNTAHDNYMGRTKLLGDIQEYNCTIQIDRLNMDLQGKYYFRVDLGGYNQYTYSEHANLYMLDEPFVSLPPEIVSGSEAELTCRVPDNCPDMKPTVNWMEIEGLEHHSVYASLEESGTPLPITNICLVDAPWKPSVNSSVVAMEGETVTILCNTQGNPDPVISIVKDKQVLTSVIFENELVLEIPAITHEHDGEYWCTAENQYGQSNSSFNLTVVFSPLVLPESQCTISKDAVQCMCSVKANPDPFILFELPEMNLTVSEGDPDFRYSQRNGYIVSSILTLQKDKDLQKPILCTAVNLYGKKVQELPFQDSDTLVWAKVGPVGAVVVFVILVAVGGYFIKTREKKKITESSSFIQTEASPTSSSGNGKKNLGKKESQFLNISGKFLLSKKQKPSHVDTDYANIDFTKRNVKDSFTSPEELTEYAEIRVK